MAVDNCYARLAAPRSPPTSPPRTSWRRRLVLAVLAVLAAGAAGWAVLIGLHSILGRS
ncbi:hypothetical protein [Catellatospora citrea]|uniref:hypothetical protein n=1 Tax=Catellatospora citrea TaxID=53366 RepID=UPI0014771AD7|nr:hypothetical protein [Catellatospora citrea]